MQNIVFNLMNVIMARASADDASGRTMRLEQATGLMLKRIKAMPVYLKFPLTILTVIFNVSGFVFAGRLFDSQSLAQQAKTVMSWQRSPLKVCREFILFYEKLTLFIYFSL